MTIKSFMMDVATEKERKESEFVKLDSRGNPFYKTIGLVSSGIGLQFVPEEAVRCLADGVEVVEVSRDELRTVVVSKLISILEPVTTAKLSDLVDYSISAENFGIFEIALLNPVQESNIVMRVDIAHSSGDMVVTLAGHEFKIEKEEECEGVNIFNVISALITKKYCVMPNVRYSVGSRFFMYRRTASVVPILLTYGDIRGRKDIETEWRPDGEETVRVRIVYDEYTRLNKVLPME